LLAGTRFRVIPVLRPAATDAAPLGGATVGMLTGYSGSVEQTRLGRRPAPRRPGRFRRGVFFIEMGEDLLDHHWIVDAGNDPHRPAAFPTGLDVDIA
jgi:hypothetical protein